jgi:hypothetical protein
MTNTIIISANGTTQSFSGGGTYLITASNGNFTFGNGATVTVSGSGNVINGSSLTTAFSSGTTGNLLIGNADTANVGTNAYLITGGYGDITNGQAGDTISVWGSGNTVNGNAVVAAFHGGGGQNTLNGSNDTLWEAAGDTAVIGGNGNAIYGQAGDTVSVWGSGNSVIGDAFSAGFHGGGKQNTLYGSNDALWLAVGDIAATVGNGDSIYGQAGDTISVYGSGNAVAGSGLTAGFHGGGGQNTLYGSYDALWLAAGDTDIIGGNSNSIYGQAGDTISVWGSGNNVAASGAQIGLNADNAAIGVQGNDNVITAGGIYDAIYLSGTDNAANISNGAVILNGNNDSALVDGSNNGIYGSGTGDVVAIAGASSFAPDHGSLSGATIIEPGYGDNASYQSNNEYGLVNVSAGAVPTVISARIMSLAPDIDNIYNMELGRDPTTMELLSAQLAAAGGQSLDQLVVTLANSDEARTEMANIYAAILPSAPIFDQGAPTTSEITGFADAMSTSYGTSIALINPATGAVLADTDPTSLLTELPVLETLANGRTLSLQLGDGTAVQFADTGRLATFLYALDVMQGGATGEVTSIYNQDIAWLNQIGQPLLETAQHYSDLAAYGYSVGQTQQAEIAQTASAMALEIAAQDPSVRLPFKTATLQLGNHIGQVSVGVDGSASEHDLSTNPLAKAAGFAAALLNVLAAAFPYTPLPEIAAAVDAAQAGEAFANGEIANGLLDLAQSVAFVLPQFGYADLAKDIRLVTQAVGGLYGATQSAQSGNGPGIAAGLLEAAAAGASSIAGGFNDPAARQLVPRHSDYERLTITRLQLWQIVMSDQNGNAARHPGFA